MPGPSTRGPGGQAPQGGRPRLRRGQASRWPQAPRGGRARLGRRQNPGARPATRLGRWPRPGAARGSGRTSRRAAGGSGGQAARHEGLSRAAAPLGRRPPRCPAGQAAPRGRARLRNRPAQRRGLAQRLPRQLTAPTARQPGNMPTRRLIYPTPSQRHGPPSYFASRAAVSRALAAPGARGLVTRAGALGPNRPRRITSSRP